VPLRLFFAERKTEMHFSIKTIGLNNVDFPEYTVNTSPVVHRFHQSVHVVGLLYTSVRPFNHGPLVKES